MCLQNYNLLTRPYTNMPASLNLLLALYCYYDTNRAATPTV